MTGVGQRLQFRSIRWSWNSRTYHGAKLRRNMDREVGESERLRANVDTGRDLDKFEAVLGEPEHGSFGDVHDLLARRDGLRPAEADHLATLHELQARSPH